ncbi:MAG: hypothetical protein II994_08845, partial [Lachnospiraceae bacterium]|nr:hypothetical protein [Lachnospiraceae bacterium]
LPRLENTAHFLAGRLSLKTYKPCPGSKMLRISSLDGCRRIIKKKATHLREQAPTVYDFLFYCMACSLAKVSL